jgi:hypothetical protein
LNASVTLSATKGEKFSSLFGVGFYRYIILQNAVEWDPQNRSNYTMFAVNPSRFSKTFTEDVLLEVVEIIGHRTDALLEIVYHNV